MMHACAEFAWPDPRESSVPPAVAAWDGRLDNADDLRRRLDGGRRSDLSDAALVCAAYERWGVEAFAALIGDWSVVISDPRTSAVVLASDYLGTRPLYYHVQRRGVVWSSQLGPIVAHTGVGTVDEEYVGDFLRFGGSARRTPWAGISVVPAGHAVRITPAGVTVHEFWTAPVGDTVRYRDERRYDEQFRALFREAVAVRLQTSAPVMAELSGGLDSSSVVCMVQDLIARGAVPAPRLTTVSYVHDDSLDTQYIREVERFCGIDGVHVSTHDTPIVTASDIGDATPEGWVPLQRAVAAAADRVDARIVLTGQNGDLVTGNRFDDSLQVAAAVRRGHLGRAVTEAMAWSMRLNVPVAHTLARAVLASLPSALTPPQLFMGQLLSTTAADGTSLTQRFLDRVGLGSPHTYFSNAWLGAPPERRAHFLSLIVLSQLRLLQRREAAGGLDYTHPFTHRPLVEFLMCVPADVLCRPGEPRRLMRRALGDLWPRGVRARRSKSLFGAPWIDALKPIARMLLATPQWRVVERGWVDERSLAARLQRLVHGLECNEPQLRQIVLLECWLRKGEQRHAGMRRTA